MPRAICQAVRRRRGARICRLALPASRRGAVRQKSRRTNRPHRRTQISHAPTGRRLLKNVTVEPLLSRGQYRAHPAEPLAGAEVAPASPQPSGGSGRLRTLSSGRRPPRRIPTSRQAPKGGRAAGMQKAFLPAELESGRGKSRLRRHFTTVRCGKTVCPPRPVDAAPPGVDSRYAR